MTQFGMAVGPALREIISVFQYSIFQKRLRSNGHKKRISKAKPVRPPTKRDLKKLVLQMAKTPGCGYTRILGELCKLGIMSISRTTVRSILKDMSSSLHRIGQNQSGISVSNGMRHPFGRAFSSTRKCSHQVESIEIRHLYSCTSRAEESSSQSQHGASHRRSDAPCC
jgi:hypothetical protein